MKFNTAIFYDIENLMGGYGKAEMLPSLSLKAIHNSLVTKDIGNIAVQRAYANWNTPRLNVLRDDIVELGINPIQMFGFGRGADKNASDIQLVIDAVELACKNEMITTYVIVSGDGGFSPLAKKLHEYGKRVIGCGYKRITNKVLENVCDDFVWLEDPLAPSNVSTLKLVGTRRKKPKFTDAVLISYANAFAPLEKPNRDQIIEEGRQIIDFIIKHKSSMHVLESRGLSISILIQALKYRLGNVEYPTIGFLRQVDYIRYIVNNSSCKLVLNKPSDYRLVLATTNLTGYEDVDPIDGCHHLHTEDYYLSLLATGKLPFFRLPKTIVIKDIIEYMLEHRSDFEDTSFVTIKERLFDALRYDEANIHAGLSCLISTTAFSFEDTETKLFERQVSFTAPNLEEALKNLEDAMHEKLTNILGKVEDVEFAKLLA